MLEFCRIIGLKKLSRVGGRVENKDRFYVVVIRFVLYFSNISLQRTAALKPTTQVYSTGFSFSDQS